MNVLFLLSLLRLGPSARRFAVPAPAASRRD